MMRTATFAVVLFAVGLMLGPAPAEAQTRPERDAYATLARAVSAAGTEPAPRRAADIRRAVERAYSVYQSQEQRREAADAAGVGDGMNNDAAESRRSNRGWIRYAELLGQSTAAYRAYDNMIPRMWDGSGGFRYTPANGMESCERSYSECREIESALRARYAAWSRAAGVHWRYIYAAADAMIEAASGLEGLAPRFIGFTMRHNAGLQRLGSAKQAAIRNQGRVLLKADACESGRCSSAVGPDDFDETLQGLVDAALAVADDLASYREGGSVAAEAEAPAPVAPVAEAPPPSPAPAAGAPASAPAVEEVEVVTLADWEAAVLRAMGDAESAARAVRAAAYWEDAHPHHERGNAATSRVLSLLNNGFRGLRPVDARGAFMREHGVSWRTINAMLAECPGKPRR